MTTTTDTADSFTGGTVYQVTDDRLFRVRGGDYATLTPGTHVLVYGRNPTGTVVEALNTRTGRIVLILNEAAYVACFRKIGPVLAADDYTDDDYDDDYDDDDC
jgi:hypothetical protein